MIRGTVLEPARLDLCDAAQERFEVFASAVVSSKADLYGGKICAAMDRQHPRDFFDVMLLLDNEGLTEEIRKAFIVYLISHSRPMAELLNARDKLLKRIHSDLTTNERKFILSVKKLHPSWDLLGVNGIDILPTVQWKLQNLGRMDKEKHSVAVERLKRCLDL